MLLDFLECIALLSNTCAAFVQFMVGQWLGIGASATALPGTAFFLIVVAGGVVSIKNTRNEQLHSL